MTLRGRTAAITVLATLALADAGLARQAHSAGSEERAHSAALAAAEKRLPLLLGYSAGSLEEDLAVAAEQTTGAFHEDYGTILEEVVAPRAAKGKVTTEADVRGVAVVSAGEDEVVVLAFLTQTTTAGSGTPSIAGSRVEVTMARTDDDWKIAGLEPV